MIIRESNMDFKFEEANIFHIEKSGVYQQVGKNVKICEFIVKLKGKILFIEAKNSFSNPQKETFDKNIHDIYQKILNSLLLYSGILLGRPYKILEKLPENLNSLKDKKLGLILIIKNHRKEWLIPIDDKLNSLFHSIKKVFLIDFFKVLNEETAEKYGLIHSDQKQ